MPTRTSLTIQESVEVQAFTNMFVAEQLSPWFGQPVEQLVKKYEYYIQESATIYQFNISEHGIDFVSKPKPFLSEGNVDPFARRAEAYRTMFAEALRIAPLNSRLTILVDMGDETRESSEFPLFAFQKPAGSRNILVPDIDMITYDYFSSFTEDTIPFAGKECRATFAGSTTGAGVIDFHKLTSNLVPRIRAARFFKDHTDVDFRLTALVQCASVEIEQALRQEGFGGRWIDWDECYRAKFGISIDGNGAACSRPAVLLLSNCVPVKYRSPNVLYYFSALECGKHYLETNSDEDVLNIIEQERRSPGVFASVAEEGRRVSEVLLSKDAVLAYTVALLRSYAVHTL